ncbi:MAG: hypothetical protein ACRC3H_26310 [Lachnospiraceae bacterium]
MIIAKNDEEKRSKLWRITITASTLVIIAVAIYFIIRMFAANPLEGKWAEEDTDVILELDKDGEAKIHGGDLFGYTDMTVKLHYTMDKTSKLITIKSDEDSIQQLTETSEGAYTADELQDLLKSYVKTFNYNLENQQLTLSDREYGSSMTFNKK